MDPILIAQVLVCAFFAACFLQSGFDKIVDWKGNLEWLTGHFSKTALKGLVPLMLGAITLLEVCAGACCAIGAIALLTGGSDTFAVAGIGLAALALTLLFTGQRIAKDYPGAASLATYFGVALVGLWILSS